MKGQGNGSMRPVDHFEAQGVKDALVEMSGALKTVAVSLVKVANRYPMDGFLVSLWHW